MFNYLDDLNDNQFQAVTTNKQKVLVMAGAGSGKTRVLTTRIRYLLDNGVDPAEICAFTFTNKAAREMQSRIKQQLGEDFSCHIQTFHSYCWSFIRLDEFYPLLGFSKRPMIMFEDQKQETINHILKKYEEDYSDIPFIKAISKIKNQSKIDDISPKDFMVVNAVYQEYQQKLIESNMVDFDDMIIHFIELCKISEEFKELVQAKHLLVDEFQDTNQTQYDLIKLMSEESGNVFVVGDEQQLIYSFRNSSIEIIRDFREHADAVYILNQNYRCNQDILKLANNLIDYNTNQLKLELFSEIKTKYPVKFNQYGTQNEEAYEVVSKIKYLIDNKLSKPEDIAILYRHNNQAYALEQELNKQSIPYIKSGGKQLFSYREIQAIINTYRVLFNPFNIIAFENMFNYPKGCEYLYYRQFIDEYHKQSKDLITFASCYAVNKHFQDLGFNLLMLQDEMKRLNNEEFFLRLLEVLGYSKFIKESNKQKPQYTRIMALLDMIRDLPKEDLEESFNQMILENLDKIGWNGVSLLTMHRAKGLEFNTVFIIGCNDEILPGFSKKGPELEEQRRCLYVAMTRAKERLFISCSQIHFINGVLRKMKPSSFLLEAGVKEASTIQFFGNYWYNK